METESRNGVKIGKPKFDSWRQMLELNRMAGSRGNCAKPNMWEQWNQAGGLKEKMGTGSCDIGNVWAAKPENEAYKTYRCEKWSPHWINRTGCI